MALLYLKMILERVPKARSDEARIVFHKKLSCLDCSKEWERSPVSYPRASFCLRTNSEFKRNFRVIIFFPQIREPIDIKAGKRMALVNTFGVGENIQNLKCENLRFRIPQTPPAFNPLVFSLC